MNRKYKTPYIPRLARKVLLLNSELNPLIKEILENERLIVEDSWQGQEDIDTVYVVTRSGGDFKPPINIPHSVEWVFVEASDQFKTDAQKQLDELEWEIIREIERTVLPHDHPLRVKRDELRARVDLEVGT